MRRILAAMLVAAVSLSALAGAGEHPWTNKRIYYVIEQGGVLVEKGSFVRRVGSFQKQACWVIEEERFIFGPANRTVPQRGIRTRTMTTLDGVALQRIETPMQDGAGQETITVSAGVAAFDAFGAYGGPGQVPVPGDVLFEIGGEYLASLRRKRGSTYTASVLDRATRGVVTTEILISGQERQAGTDTPDVWLADIATPGRPPVIAWYTPDGRLMRLEGGGMEYQVVPRADYEVGRIPVRGIEEAPPEEPRPPRRQQRRDQAAVGTGTGTASGTGTAGRSARDAARQPSRSGTVGTVRIPIGASVPAWDSFAWLLVNATPAYEWNNALTSSEYAQIRLNGDSVAITALRNAPLVDSNIDFPMNIPPDVRPFLLASELVPSDHQAVVEAAYAAVADGETKREERNVLRAISFLAGWVNQSVAVEEWGGYDSNALATLAARSGDSLGHARLFSAMARTLGVPTRLCQGFLARVDGAVYHCWSEVWIGGRWIPVDTTVSRVGLPAGYVLAERGQGNGEFRFDFANFMRSNGLRLRLVSAGRETPSGGQAELVVGDRRSYAFSENDWLTNLYWGFALRLPDKWQGRARLNSVELSSPDRQASVRCEALEGDFAAGRAELDETVESLRKTLSRFKVVNSRIVAFDADGATPAMFIDFTCVEDGKTLRCRQYIVPRRERAFRLSFWAPTDEFRDYMGDFDSILASVEF